MNKIIDKVLLILIALTIIVQIPYYNIYSIESFLYTFSISLITYIMLLSILVTKFITKNSIIYSILVYGLCIATIICRLREYIKEIILVTNIILQGIAYSRSVVIIAISIIKIIVDILTICIVVRLVNKTYNKIYLISIFNLILTSIVLAIHIIYYMIYGSMYLESYDTPYILIYTTILAYSIYCYIHYKRDFYTSLIKDIVE